MDIDRFLAKPVEVEIAGVKVNIKPLTVQYYPLIAKLTSYEQKIIAAQNRIQKGEQIDLSRVLTPEEIEKHAELESELAFRSIEENFEGITREKFNEFRFDVIQKIMEGVMKANGLTDEKLSKIKSMLGNDK